MIFSRIKIIFKLFWDCQSKLKKRFKWQLLISNIMSMRAPFSLIIQIQINQGSLVKNGHDIS